MNSNSCRAPDQGTNLDLQQAWSRLLLKWSGVSRSEIKGEKSGDRGRA